MAPITLIVVTNVQLYQEGLSHALNADARFTVVASANSRQEATTKLANLPVPPDVALLDLGMLDGAQTAQAFVPRLQATRIIALAVGDSDAEVVRWAQSGVAALVGREASLAELAFTIEAVIRGEAPCSPRIGAALMRRVASTAPSYGVGTGGRSLTPREREVGALLAEGLANKQIAAELVVELSTIKNHVHNLLEKLGARSRTEAAAMLRHRGLDRGPVRAVRGPGPAPRSTVDLIRIH
jgi:two-component system nitrate/nitrite response regulator NarL